VEDVTGSPEARVERLERWAAQQSRLQLRRPPEEPRPDELAARVPWRAKRIAAGVKRQLMSGANRVLDRGLNTTDLAVEPEHDHFDRLPYKPSAWHVLPRALRYLGVSHHDTFVDFGCGKGRVLHQAAKRPFRRVVGVEISPALADVARAGLAARSHEHRCRDVEIVVADAKDYQVPDDLTIAYVFHSFRGETLDAVLRGITDSIDRNPRRVRLIYVHPVFNDTVLGTGRFRLMKMQRGGLRADHLNRAAIYESF
jgi:SAM-dependent methyltransferase